MINSMRLFQHPKYKTWYVEFERGKTRALRTKDEKKAKEVYRHLEKEWLKGRLLQLDEGKRITLAEFTKEYIKSRSDLDPDTLRMDSLALRNLADVVGKTTAIKAINAKKIDRFKSACRARGLSPHSINAYLRHIRAAFNQAVEWEYIKKVPRIKSVKVGKHQPRILTKDEINRILDYARKHEFQMWRMISFALWTGTRREEIIILKWQNVTEDSCKIRGKGDKDRTVPLLPGALEAMGESKDIGPVFWQWHKDTVSKKFKKIARMCGIEDIHFHNLRHSAATQMVASGIKLEVIQRILGHSDIRTTQIYAQIYDQVVQDEMKKLRY